MSHRTATPRRPLSRSRSTPAGVDQSKPKPQCPEPTNIGKFFSMIILYVSKSLLFLETPSKVGYYLVVVTVGSIITDIVPLPRTYFADKSNLFNQTFVKWGWGWTLILLMSFVALTSWIYTCGDKKSVRRHLARLAVSTAWWFVCVRFFTYIEMITGLCSSHEYKNKQLCHKAGYRWIGFDISGHAFLLIHCLLTISEEVKCLKGWERIPELLKTEEDSPHKLNPEDAKFLNMHYPFWTPIIKVLFVLLALLSLLWEAMLISTVLYFHNMPQKLLGALVAVCAWFLSYRVIYQTLWSLSGQGKFQYYKP